jgi:hypothetical protein
MEMARIEARTLCLIALALTPALARDFEFPARHDHWRKGCAGLLRIEADGISFTQVGGKKLAHQHRWAYQDIQQLEVTDGRIVRVLSYRDRRLLLGKDQPFEFTLDGKPDLMPVYQALRDRLDQRFIARLGDIQGQPLWQIEVKRLGAIRGTEGTLAVFADRVVYHTKTTAQSRTWRDADLVNISSAGPFQLTVTTLEKRGVFDFQLKQPLNAANYDSLWLRLNKPRGLALISDKKEN